jgi:hypothetical protein
MRIKRITVLLVLFIFGSANCVWADEADTRNGGFYDRQAQKDAKFELRFLLEGLKANHRLKLIESIDKIVSLYKLPSTPWIYKLLDHQGVKERKFLNSEFKQSIPRLSPSGNRYLEEDGAKVTFELLESKLKKAEILMLFHITFNPKGERTFLEMHVTPSSEKGINFLIPF